MLLSNDTNVALAYLQREQARRTSASMCVLLLQAEGSDSDSSDDELTTYTNRDGTQSSATAAELKLAAELSKDPWGRFGGRAGKMARIRAQEAQELAAMQVYCACSTPAMSGLHRKITGQKSFHGHACSRRPSFWCAGAFLVMPCMLCAGEGQCDRHSSRG